MATKNFDVELKKMNGEPFMSGETGKPLIIRDVVVAACAMAFFDQATGAKQLQESGNDMLKRYKLGMRIQEGGDQPISDEESVLIKRLVSLVPHWGADIVGQVYEFLDK